MARLLALSWSPSPALLGIRDRIALSIGRSLHAKVSSIIDNGRWKRPRRCAITLETIAYNAANLFPNVLVEDKVIWSYQVTSGALVPK